MPGRNLRVYQVLFAQAWRESFGAPQKIAASLFVLFLRIGVLLTIYRIAYQVSGKTPNGISFVAAIWSIGCYFVLLSGSVRALYQDISKDVQSGAIEVRFTKPYFYPLAMIAERVGRGLPTMLMAFVVLVGFLGILVGWPPIILSVGLVLKTLLVFLAGTILASLLYTLIGLTAFWLDDATPVYWIVDKMVMLLGGAYIPVLLFPQKLQEITLFLPFGGFTAVAQAVHPSFEMHWVPLFISQLVWIGILLVSVHLVFRRASQRISINGG